MQLRRRHFPISAALVATLVVAACGGVVRVPAGQGGASPTGGAAGAVMGSGGSSGAGGDMPMTGGSGGSYPGSGGSYPGSGGSYVGTGGSGGTGTTIPCGGNTCTGVNVIITTAHACCAGTNHDECGVDTSPLQGLGLTFNPSCQAKNQPGKLDSSCPDFKQTVSGIVIDLPGCCRAATSTCGYMADEVAGIVNLQMGCIDSTPFLEGGAPASCGGAADGGTDAGP